MSGTSEKKFGLEPPMAYGGHSGFQVINLAFLHGHRDVWLLGYDMGFEPGTPKHFFGEHPQGVDRCSQYADWIDRFRKAKPIMDVAGLKITNMTRRTALDVFERGSLCEFL